MKQKNHVESIEIPQGIDIKLDGYKVSLKGKQGESSKEFRMPTIKLSMNGRKIEVLCQKYGSYDKEKINTVIAHINNMIKGCQKGYVYALKVCSSHFPATVTVSGNKFIVKNLFGEKVPRELLIKAGAKVTAKGDSIEVTGTDKEIVSQVAADIEKLTKIADRDRRVFQDGIYIVSKDEQKIG